VSDRRTLIVAAAAAIQALIIVHHPDGNRYRPDATPFSAKSEYPPRTLVLAL
jgi:hypothetical protein